MRPTASLRRYQKNAILGWSNQYYYYYSCGRTESLLSLFLCLRINRLRHAARRRPEPVKSANDDITSTGC